MLGTQNEYVWKEWMNRKTKAGDVTDNPWKQVELEEFKTNYEIFPMYSAPF